MVESIKTLIHTIANMNFLELAKDPKLLIPIIIIFVLSIYFKWKWILSLLLFAGGSFAVIKYMNPAPIRQGVDPSLTILIGGTLLVGVAIIYILFISGD